MPSSAVEALLRDLGPQIRRGVPPEQTLGRFCTGIDEFDALLGGGFPRGRLSEIAGPHSSGRTSLALALLARATQPAPELAAIVDLDDAFDPSSAQAAGVCLDQLLWVRPPALREALRSTERLLEAQGFGLVLLDLGAEDAVRSPAWARLRRSAASAGASLVVLSTRRIAGSAAEIALELPKSKPRFSGTPLLLEGLDARVALARARTPGPRCVSLRLHGLAA